MRRVFCRLDVFSGFRNEANDLGCLRAKNLAFVNPDDAVFFAEDCCMGFFVGSFLPFWVVLESGPFAFL